MPDGGVGAGWGEWRRVGQRAVSEEVRAGGVTPTAYRTAFGARVGPRDTPEGPVEVSEILTSEGSGPI